MFAHKLRPGAQDKIHRCIHCRQVEIEISGRLPTVPALRTAGWLGIDITQREKTVCSLAGPSFVGNGKSKYLAAQMSKPAPGMKFRNPVAFVSQLLNVPRQFHRARKWPFPLAHLLA